MGALRFSDFCDEESFGVVVLGPNFDESCVAGCDVEVDRLELCVGGGEEVLDDCFVFFGFEAAGGVDEGSCWFEEVVGVADQFFLEFSQSAGGVLVPRFEGGGGGCGVAFDESAAGAGGVKEDVVEEEGGVEFVAGVLGDEGVGDVAALEVGDERVDPIGVGFVGDEDAGVVHEGCEVRCFCSGCGAEVEDDVVGLGVEDEWGEEGDAFLDEVQSVVVFGEGAEVSAVVFVGDGESVVAPGGGGGVPSFGCESWEELFRGGEEGVDADG